MPLAANFCLDKDTFVLRASALHLPLRDESVQAVVTSPPYWSLRRYDGQQDVLWDENSGCSHQFEPSIAKASHYTGKRRWQHIASVAQEANRLARSGSTLERGTRTQAEAKIARMIKVRDLDPEAWGHPEIGTGAFCVNCRAWRGPFGLEPTPDLYVDHTVLILREIRRVLRSEGIVWWNIGDTYFGSWGDYVAPSHEGTKPLNDNRWARPAYQQVGYHERPPSASKHPVLKSKDLCLIPFRVALAAQADGWWVRSVIVWDKPNAMPESVKDRPTRGHEYLLMLTKSKRYFFNQDAVREPHKPDSHNPHARGGIRQLHGGKKGSEMNSRYRAGNNYNFRGWAKGGRNIRTVWRFPTRPCRDAHFATFPEELPRRCILASTRPGDVVLDPFAGSGTTGVVAMKLGRRAILADLAYQQLALRRLGQMSHVGGSHERGASRGV